MSNNHVSRPSSAVYAHGSARARLTIRIMIYILSVFLVGTILSYFVFYNGKEDNGIAGTEINRSAFGEITSKGRFDAWDGTTYTAPTKTATKVYSITTASQFAYLWYNAHTSLSSSEYCGATFILNADIDLTAKRSPIYYFNGTLNGNGHTIKIDVSHGPLFSNANTCSTWQSGYSTSINDLTVEATGEYTVNSIYYGIVLDTTATGGAWEPGVEIGSGNVQDWMGFIMNVRVKPSNDGPATITYPVRKISGYDTSTTAGQIATQDALYMGSVVGFVAGMLETSDYSYHQPGTVASCLVEDGIFLRFIADDKGTWIDYQNTGAYYIGGIAGCFYGPVENDTNVWMGQIYVETNMNANVTRTGLDSVGLLNIDGREISVGGIVGGGSCQVSVSQGVIDYRYTDTGVKDLASIGGITGTQFLDTDDSSVWAVVDNSWVAIDSKGDPRLVTYGTEKTCVFNQERITIDGDSNPTTNGVGSRDGATTDANMKSQTTYTKWAETGGLFDFVGTTTSEAFILDEGINDGYPMINAFADITETVAKFNPSSAGTVGAGSQTEPFIISTKAQFLSMADYYNNNTKTTAGYYWKISPYESTTGAQITFDLGNNWKPIGYDKDHAFTGHLDGGRVVITGLGITSNYEYVGLFGYVSAGATISNLGISANTGSVNDIAYDYDQASYVGGLVGYLAKGAYVENCYFIGKLTGYLNSNASRTVGGLAGYYDNAVANSSATPAIKTSYYIADHKIYYKTGTTTNTKSEHMEKIYGTGATASSSTVTGTKDFTSQSTFTPFGFTFGNLSLVSGTTNSYAWTADYAGKWHTTAGLYNGYPYLDASDAYSYQVNRASCTNGTLTGSWTMGSVNEGNLVFTSNLSQSLPLRANINFNYTKDANYDAKITLKLQKNTSTFLTKEYEFNNKNTSVKITGFTTGTSVKCEQGSLVVADNKYARHTLAISNNGASLGTITRTDSNANIVVAQSGNTVTYNGRGQLTFNITANDFANGNYYFISKIVFGATTMYDANANKTAINTPTGSIYSAKITSVVTSDGTNNPGTAVGCAKAISLSVSLPNNAETTAVMVYFGKVSSVNKNVIFNTAEGTESLDGVDEKLTIVPGTKITDKDGNAPTVKTEEAGVDKTTKGEFIGWLVNGELVSSETELDYVANDDTATVAELWSYKFNVTLSNYNSAHSYEITHVNTGLRYTVTSANISMMVGKCIIKDLTTNKTGEFTVEKAMTFDLSTMV